MTLTLVVVASALGVVHSRFETRQLFVELRALTTETDELVIAWAKLQLEEGTVSTNGTIEKEARERLNMHLPKYEFVEHVTR